MWRLLRYQHDLNVQDPFLVADAGRFIAWQKLLTHSTLSCKPMVEAFLQVAVQSAGNDDGRAAAIAAKRFADWLQEGPAKGLKRQHLLSRTAAGWTPSREGAEPETVINEFDEVDGISLDELKRTLQPNSNASTPLASQSSANAERADWGEQWASHCKHDQLQWPDSIETEQMQHLTLKHFREALFSFPAGTGLSWDGLHPRALLRLPDSVLYQWIALMLLCERVGVWPKQTGVVVVVLLP